jgi:hypothetical protein
MRRRDDPKISATDGIAISFLILPGLMIASHA